MKKSGAEFGIRTDMYVAVPKDASAATRNTVQELTRGGKTDDVLDIVRGKNLSFVIVPKITPREDVEIRSVLPSTIVALGQLRDDAFRQGDALNFNLRDGGTKVVFTRTKRVVKIGPTKA